MTTLMIDYPAGACTHTHRVKFSHLRFQVALFQWFPSMPNGVQQMYVFGCVCAIVKMLRFVEFTLWELQEVNCDGLTFLILIWIHKILFFVFCSSFYWAKQMKTRQNTIFIEQLNSQMLIFFISKFQDMIGYFVNVVLVLCYFTLILYCFICYRFICVYTRHTQCVCAVYICYTQSVYFGFYSTISIEAISSEFVFLFLFFLHYITFTLGDLKNIIR